jgi:hypothetical protein
LPNTYDIVLSLTSEKLTDSERLRMLRDFANDMGWRPSYYLIEPPLTSQYANAHLVVEHGLQPSAVITFLDKAHHLADIQLPDLHQLLSISYNNLVDWHLYVEADEITFCFNRKKPLYTESRRISRSDYASLHNEAFDQIVGRKPTPNLPSLDQALIETISSWRRALSAELKYAVPTVNLSALFNALLFVRTVEDQNRRIEPSSRQLLLEEWATGQKLNPTLAAVILSAMRKMVGTNVPKFLIDEDRLAAFDSVCSQRGLLPKWFGKSNRR